MVRLAVLLWLLLATSAVAQVITVRSGQHDGFARLVLTFPSPEGWDFGRTADGYGFRVRTRNARFDISTVFDLIPRDRLAAIWVDPDSGVLRLGLGCACHAIASPFRPGIVVIDIVDGAAPVDSPFEQALDNAGRSMPALPARATLRPRPRPRDFMQTASAVAFPTLPPLWIPAERTGAGPRIPVLPAQPDARALAMRDRLMEDLSRAIATGAVDPVATLPKLDHPGNAAAGPLLLPSVPATVNTPVQLRMRPAGAAPESDTTESGERCVASDRLDLASWGSTGSPGDQLAAAHSRLIGEFDRPNRDRVIALARLYLHFGFGVEARSLIGTWAADDSEAEVLVALALLVDGGGGAQVFAGMHPCDGASALWAVLSDPEPPRAQQVNLAAVVRTFSDLPVALRRHLGPSLSDRFIAVKDNRTAQAIRDAINRAPGPHGDAVTMIDARMAEASGMQTLAEDKFRDVVRSDGVLAPQAVAALVDSQVRRGEVPAPDMILTLEALTREYRDAPEAEALRAALARALTISGAAEQALREIAAGSPALYPDLWILLAKHADATTLAALALAPPGPPLTDLPEAPRLAVARGLVAAGFPENARIWLSGLETEPARLLRAEAALANKNGREALRALGGLAGPSADPLRATALELLGDLAAAQAVWLTARVPERAERAGFLNRDWSGLQPPPETALAAMLASRQGGLSDIDTQDTTPLAHARALLAHSGSARALVREFLAGKSVVTD